MGTQPVQQRKRIADILLDAGVVTSQQVEEGLRHQKETGERIGEALVSLGAASEEDIGWALSRQLSLTFVDLHLDALDAKLIRGFPKNLLRRVQAVPLVRSEKELSVALADPTDQDALDEIEASAGIPLRVGVATTTNIRTALDHVFGAKREARSSRGDRLRLIKTDHPLAWERSGIAFLQFHLDSALKWPATEIHFLPNGDRLEICYRIGPDLNRVASEPLEVLEGLLIRIETLDGPTISREDISKQGQISVQIEDRTTIIDVSLAQTLAGTSVVLFPRIQAHTAPDLGDLGFRKEQEDQVRALIEQPAGLLVVSGPPRCGGSTTLAALHRLLDSGNRRSVVIETKTTCPYPGATRFVLDPEQARTEWKSIVAMQSADILVLDSILNGITIQKILSPEASGRLLLIRTDWTETNDLLDFLLHVPQARAVLAKRFLGVIQQRLVRFGESEPRPTETLLPSWQQGVFEVLTLDEESRAAIREGEGRDRVLSRASKRGFSSLALECRRLVEEGTLSAAEAARTLR